MDCGLLAAEGRSHNSSFALWQLRHAGSPLTAAAALNCFDTAAAKAE